MDERAQEPANYPHRLETCGYVPVRNDAAESGLWVINGARQVVYAKRTLSAQERAKAVRELVNWSGKQSKQ